MRASIIFRRTPEHRPIDGLRFDSLSVPELRSLLWDLNAATWPSDDDRRRVLVPYGQRMMGAIATLERRRAIRFRIADVAVREIVPEVLERMGSSLGQGARDLREIVDPETATAASRLAGHLWAVSASHGKVSAGAASDIARNAAAIDVPINDGRSVQHVIESAGAASGSADSTTMERWAVRMLDASLSLCDTSTPTPQETGCVTVPELRVLTARLTEERGLDPELTRVRRLYSDRLVRATATLEQRAAIRCRIADVAVREIAADALERGGTTKWAEHLRCLPEIVNEETARGSARVAWSARGRSVACGFATCSANNVSNQAAVHYAVDAAAYSIAGAASLAGWATRLLQAALGLCGTKETT